MEEKTVDHKDPSINRKFKVGVDSRRNSIFYRFGRKPLEIPVSKESLNELVIQQYLPFILEKFTTNIGDYKHLHNVYCGNSNIQMKERPFGSDKTNIIIDEHHPYSMVEFKKGYMYGDDVKYSCYDDSTCTDEITYLGKYMKDQKKSLKNVSIAADVYVAGAGNRVIFPKQRGAPYDGLKIAPFDIYNLDYDSSFIVYSANYTHEKLFGGIITTIDSANPDDVEYELMIYDHMYSYRFRCSQFGIMTSDLRFIGKQRHYIGMCPFIEYKINESRIGIVEVVEAILDGANLISSNSVDNVIDYVNSILTVYNQKISKDTKKNVESTGTMELLTVDPTRPADAKYLVNALNHGDVNTKYEALVKIAYNIVGVPQATTQSTSGGDTGQARELGGGWSRADVVARQDEICLKEAESCMIDIVCAICKKNPKSPIKTLCSSDIEINFNRTKRDNILTKTQALQNLYAMKIPHELALNYVGISANAHEDAKAWEENERKVQKENDKRMMEQQKVENKVVQTKEDK